LRCHSQATVEAVWTRFRDLTMPRITLEATQLRRSGDEHDAFEVRVEQRHGHVMRSVLQREVITSTQVVTGAAPSSSACDGAGGGGGGGAQVVTGAAPSCSASCGAGGGGGGGARVKGVGAVPGVAPAGHAIHADGTRVWLRELSLDWKTPRLIRQVGGGDDEPTSLAVRFSLKDYETVHTTLQVMSIYIY